MAAPVLNGSAARPATRRRCVCRSSGAPPRRTASVDRLADVGGERLAQLAQVGGGALGGANDDVADEQAGPLGRAARRRAR